MVSSPRALSVYLEKAGCGRDQRSAPGAHLGRVLPSLDRERLVMAPRVPVHSPCLMQEERLGLGHQAVEPRVGLDETLLPRSEAEARWGAPETLSGYSGPSVLRPHAGGCPDRCCFQREGSFLCSF